MAAVRGVNANNYVAAGQAAIRNSIRGIQEARDAAPKYDELMNEARLARAREKQAAFKAESQVARAGIEAEVEIRRANIKADMDKSIARSKMNVRKAGVVAAVGQTLGEAFKKDGPEPFKPYQPDRSGSEKLLQQMLADAEGEITAPNNMT